jgi:Protein of unknown function (DUF1189)
VNFFNELHRSMVDPQFYKEVLTFKRSRVAFYVILLLLLTSIVTVIAQWWYQIESDEGIPNAIELALSGMEIKDGLLDPHVQTPFVPSSKNSWPLMSTVFFQNGMIQATDTLLIIDTSASQAFKLKAPYFALGKDRVYFNYDDKYFKASISYATLLNGKKSLQFTASEIRSLLTSLSFLPTILISLFVTTMLQNVVTILFSIVFLAVAAFIFRIERVTGFSIFLRASTYAITPMALGLMLIEVSGVQVVWGWHLLIFISTIVLFRGVVAIGKASPVKESEEDNV